MADHDGGRAFPSSNDVTVGEFITQGHAGMSLRDYFAGQALAGLSSEYGVSVATKIAYEMADAMLHARMVDR